MSVDLVGRPVVGVGHSCGALLHVIICSLFLDEREPPDANVLLSFNNTRASDAMEHGWNFGVDHEAVEAGPWEREGEREGERWGRVEGSRVKRASTLI